MSKKFLFHKHPSALVETQDIGEKTHIWAFVHVLKGASIGKNCSIGDGCYIEGGARVGDNVTMKNGNALWEGVTIADNVFIGPSVVFTNDLTPRSPRMPLAAGLYKSKEWCQKTFVDEGASLGANATILCGHRIGRFAMVGAGAVVTHDVPPFALVVGNPARIRNFICRCGSSLDFKRNQANCSKCKYRYQKRGESINESAFC